MQLKQAVRKRYFRDIRGGARMSTAFMATRLKDFGPISRWLKQRRYKRRRQGTR